MCLYKPETTKKHKSQLLIPIGYLPSLWTLSYELWAPASVGTRRGNDVTQSTEYYNVVCCICQENILKPIKVRWPNLSCWGSHSIPCIQLTHHALSLSAPSQHIQPEPSIACLTWHIITVEIFVYFVRVPQSALQPTAKSSQLPPQLSQPESLIKTRCFHLGQLWKKSLPEWGFSLPSPAAVGFAMCGKADILNAPKKGFFFFSFFLPKCATEWRLLHQSGLKEHTITQATWNIALKIQKVIIKTPHSLRSSL